MNNKMDIVAIRTNDTVLLFSAVGCVPIIKESLAEVEKTIFQLSKKSKIIFIDEELYEKIPETIATYQSSLFPMIIPVPMKEEGIGVGLNKVKKNVEKAIGINIF